MFDAIIIGAGVIGAAVAYELSRYGGKFLVLEKGEDLCAGTTKANSGIAHGGYDALPGTMKAKMNMAGIRMMAEMSRVLDFPYHKIGTLVLCHDESQISDLEELLERGKANGVPGLKILNHDEVLEMEPNLADTVVAALYCSEAGVVNPFLMNIAYGEQAAVNGVDFHFNEKVLSLERSGEGPDSWLVRTSEKIYETRAVINCAGVHSDEVSHMASSKPYSIRPRRGEYMLLDKEAGNMVHHVIFNLPSKAGKGILITPTTENNLLVGPTSEFIDDKDNVETTREGLDKVYYQSGTMVESIPYYQVITSFTGLRAHEEQGDFVLEETEEGFFNCLGIESPGLTSAPAIGVYMANLVKDKLGLDDNPDFIGQRTDMPHFYMMNQEERHKLIEKDKAYGRIVCRCEEVTEGEIVEAIHRPLGARTLDGIKRRVRPMAGRCQGGFCTPLLIKILCRELGLEASDILKNRPGSYLVEGPVKALPIVRSGQESQGESHEKL